ncbi:uncharacterized protein EDB91DRAFT_1255133 [Suillus paluster]|uniref:uncharacterized protein n=1 Tax=Suillus paluster TaxID=48578 RepID=UPI001B876D74|nr:uncharacterized protein EDB91DRAFT_1255133 [Suillus paluster]KAG1724636.1 hypothetical protein EDB91DRAFT_1255133 [Suillus paluster]
MASSQRRTLSSPQILVDDSGAGEVVDAMVCSGLEDKWKSDWLDRIEQREVQIQILLYVLKLNHEPRYRLSNRSQKRKNEKPNFITPSSVQLLQFFIAGAASLSAHFRQQPSSRTKVSFYFAPSKRS